MLFLQCTWRYCVHLCEALNQDEGVHIEKKNRTATAKALDAKLLELATHSQTSYVLPHIGVFSYFLIVHLGAEFQSCLSRFSLGRWLNKPPTFLVCPGDFELQTPRLKG